LSYILLHFSFSVFNTVGLVTGRTSSHVNSLVGYSNSNPQRSFSGRFLADPRPSLE